MLGSGRWIRLTTAGVVAFSICLPAANVTAAVLAGADRPTLVVDLAATALYVPPFLALVWSRVCARSWPRSRAYALLLAMAVVIFGVVPWAGSWWPRSFSALALAVLVVLPVPSSLLVYGVLWIAPIPLAWCSGDAGLWIWGVLPVNAVLGPYVLLRLAESARQLATARRRLAAEAVARERQHIDEELREVVGAGLTAIADQAGRAVARAEIEQIVGCSRATLAGARRLTRGYRQQPLSDALASAASLLDAAGVRVRIEPSPEPLDAAQEERVRTALRAAVARMMDGDAGAYVLTVRGDGLSIEAVP